MTLSSLLDSQASFTLAVVFVTWVAVVLLGLVAANLHTRLRLLENAGPVRDGSAPYSHLHGRSVWPLLGDAATERHPRLILFLSTSCRSCRRIVRELESDSWPIATGVVWTDQIPAPAPAFPPHVRILEEGWRLSDELGIRVTPFMLIVGADGRTIEASPVVRLDRLERLVQHMRDLQHA